MKKLLICLLIFVGAIFISCNFVINATTTKTVPEQPMIQTEPLSLIVEASAPSTDILLAEEPEPTPEPEPLATREEIELLALCTMAEAEGECEQGQRLVIDSVLNRVDDPHFPNTISEVIWQKNQYAGKTHYDEREDRYLKAIAKYRKEEQALFPELLAEMTVALEKNPDQDFLGEVYMRMRLGSDELKQIFTPYNVCHFMALATMGNVAEQVEKSGFITVHDDCCGGGATLIAAANVARNDLEKAGFNFQNHILFSAQDIEETVALMCYIQLSLLGVAGFVKVGNSLTDQKW